MWRETAIERCESAVLPGQSNAVDQALVPRRAVPHRCLPRSSPDDSRGYATSAVTSLDSPAAAPTPNQISFWSGSVVSRLAMGIFNCSYSARGSGLGYTQKRDTRPTVESRNSLLPQNLGNTIQTVPVTPSSTSGPRLVQLQASLHQPDGVCGNPNQRGGGRGGDGVDGWRIWVQMPCVACHPLAVAIRKGPDRAGRNNASEARAKPAVEASPAFGAVD